ncbi:MAG: hypothetical protein WDA16_14085 [Candidatus Thermoplasmatota archaeon]
MSAGPAGKYSTDEYATKRAELDATLERLLLEPPGHAHERGAFASEYDRLAERRRVLAAEVLALEAALHEDEA